jgi:hypothetical protein
VEQSAAVGLAPCPFHEATYSFLPTSLEILEEKLIRDKNNDYMVLRQQILIEPRTDHQQTVR